MKPTLLKTLFNVFMDIISILTLIATLRVSKKVNTAVEWERLYTVKEEILGSLDSFTRKMDNQINCTDQLLNQIKCFIQELTVKYSVLKTVNTRILIFYLDKDFNHNSFKIRNRLLRITKMIEGAT